MTLVLAELNRVTSEGMMVADTLVTSGADNYRSKVHILKIGMVDEGTVLGFAGSPEIATEAFQKLRNSSKSHENVEMHVSHLIRFSGVDFLMMTKDEIIKIKNGCIDRGLEFAWIGDEAGFELFELAKNGYSTRTGKRFEHVGHDMFEVFNGIAQQNVCDSVRAPLVSASLRQGKAKYDCMMSLSAPRQQPFVDGGWQSIDFGTAVNGGFGYTTVVPCDSDKSCWAIYYFQARQGAVFEFLNSQKPSGPLWIQAGTAAEFATLVGQKFGFAFEACGELG